MKKGLMALVVFLVIFFGIKGVKAENFAWYDAEKYVQENLTHQTPDQNPVFVDEIQKDQENEVKPVATQDADTDIDEVEIPVVSGTDVTGE